MFLNVKSAVPLLNALNSLLTISENFISYFSYAKTHFSSTIHYIISHRAQTNNNRLKSGYNFWITNNFVS